MNRISIRTGAVRYFLPICRDLLPVKTRLIGYAAPPCPRVFRYNLHLEFQVLGMKAAYTAAFLFGLLDRGRRLGAQPFFIVFALG
ncbi:hypothetical protein C2I18_16705 [Paenibacillus sp. PK3_47]|nr:hypothetical protein C2I18_16705 [Paenibacillus sp. PK3_47]